MLEQRNTSTTTKTSLSYERSGPRSVSGSCTNDLLETRLKSIKDNPKPNCPLVCCVQWFAVFNVKVIANVQHFS